MLPVPNVLRFVSPLLLASSLFVSGAASAQLLQQTLKDVWVASSTNLYQANFDDDGDGIDERGVFVKNAVDSSRSFEAIAFELPSFDTFGGSSTPFRNLVAIDDSRLVRFENGSNETPPKLLFDAGGSPSNLKSVNTVAVTPAGTLLISGYSKSKKVFELWEVTKLPVDNANQQVVLRATGTPQLTDSVFVADGIVAGSTLGNGGLLAAAGKQVLFFPVPANWNPANTTAKLSYQVLAETSDLPVKSNAVLTSAELVRGTDVLMIATSERTLLTRPVPGGAVTKFATLPTTANGVSCTNLRTQRVLVRSARSGEQKASVVSDICGEVLRYSFTNPSTASTAPRRIAPSRARRDRGRRRQSDRLPRERPESLHVDDRIRGGDPILVRQPSSSFCSSTTSAIRAWRDRLARRPRRCSRATCLTSTPRCRRLSKRRSRTCTSRYHPTCTAAERAASSARCWSGPTPSPRRRKRRSISRFSS